MYVCMIHVCMHLRTSRLVLCCEIDVGPREREYYSPNSVSQAVLVTVGCGQRCAWQVYEHIQLVTNG